MVYKINIEEFNASIREHIRSEHKISGEVLTAQEVINEVQREMDK